MPGSVRALRVNTVELRRQPGTERRVPVELVGRDLGVEEPAALADAQVAGELVATSTLDGIVVTGELEVRWADQCRRCLREVTARVTSEVDELYQEQVSDPDAFELGPDALDLTALVHDVVLLAVDEHPLCRPDCAGLCPTCGADRNEGDCGCSTEVRDDRWAALDQLRLDEPGG